VFADVLSGVISGADAWDQFRLREGREKVFHIPAKSGKVQEHFLENTTERQPSFPDRKRGVSEGEEAVFPASRGSGWTHGKAGPALWGVSVRKKGKDSTSANPPSKTRISLEGKVIHFGRRGRVGLGRREKKG